MPWRYSQSCADWQTVKTDQTVGSSKVSGLYLGSHDGPSLHVSQKTKGTKSWRGVGNSEIEDRRKRGKTGHLGLGSRPQCVRLLRLGKRILLFLFFQLGRVIFNILFFVLGLWHSKGHKMSSFLFCYVFDQSVIPNCWAWMPVMLAILWAGENTVCASGHNHWLWDQSDMGFEYWPTLGKWLALSEPQGPCL